MEKLLLPFPFHVWTVVEIVTCESVRSLSELAVAASVVVEWGSGPRSDVAKLWIHDMLLVGSDLRVPPT